MTGSTARVSAFGSVVPQTLSASTMVGQILLQQLQHTSSPRSTTSCSSPGVPPQQQRAAVYSTARNRKRYRRRAVPHGAQPINAVERGAPLVTIGKPAYDAADPANARLYLALHAAQIATHRSPRHQSATRAELVHA